MMRTMVGGRFLEALLFGVSSLLLYFFGVGSPFFLVPLQVIAVRRGPSGTAAAGAFAVAGLAAVRLAGALRGPLGPGSLALDGAEVAVFLVLAGGLAAANLRLGRTRMLLKLLAATGLVCLAGSLIAAALASSPAVRGEVAAWFESFSTLARSVWASGDSVASTVRDALLAPESLAAIAGEVFPRVFVPAVFMFLAFSWWAGTAAGARASGAAGAGKAWRFAAFRLEAWWLWPLIASLALAGADLLAGGRAGDRAWLAYASYAAWNAAFLVMFLFGLQGLAILRFLYEKHSGGRFLWVLGVAVLIAMPGLNVVATVALPLLGASENWIRYRSGGAGAARDIDRERSDGQ